MRYHHLIITAYGFWLPNDPRGSGSSEVKAQHLFESGGYATKVSTSRSVAAKPHDRAASLAAKKRLKWPAVRFSGRQARAIVRGIAQQLPKIELKLFALAIMPDHLHAVSYSPLSSNKQMAFMKASGTRGLNAEGLHPLARMPKSNGRVRSPWAAGGRWVKLETERDVRRTIRYVEQNPIKSGLRAQIWSCVEELKSFAFYR